MWQPGCYLIKSTWPNEVGPGDNDCVLQSFTQEYLQNNICYLKSNFTGSEMIQSRRPTEAPGKFGASALLFGQGSNRAIGFLKGLI